MKCLIISIFLCLVLAGCATAKKIYTSEGQEGYSINCSGTAMTWGVCYEKAGQLCGEKGYIVLEKMGDQGSVLSGSQFGLYGSSVIYRSLVIKCKD